jgi:hypothetical protein
MTPSTALPPRTVVSSQSTSLTEYGMPDILRYVLSSP